MRIADVHVWRSQTWVASQAQRRASVRSKEALVDEVPHSRTSKLGRERQLCLAEPKFRFRQGVAIRTAVTKLLMRSNRVSLSFLRRRQGRV